jgi:hypothetical protein
MTSGLPFATWLEHSIATKVINAWCLSIIDFGEHSSPRTAPKEFPMYDIFMGLVFVAVVMAPCVAVLTTKLDEKGWR